MCFTNCALHSLLRDMRSRDQARQGGASLSSSEAKLTRGLVSLSSLHASSTQGTAQYTL